MDYRIQNITNYFLYSTPVDNLFLEEFMCSAPGDFVKCYLSGLMHANLNEPVDHDTLARQLGIPSDRLIEAWNYWEKQGIVRLHYENPEKPEHFYVEFLNLRELAYGVKGTGGQSHSSGLPDKDSLGTLFVDIQAATGRMLDSREMEDIIGWVSDYKMQPELILFCYKYCSENRRSNKGSYVGVILKDWKSKGLDNVLKVKTYLAECDRNFSIYRRIFRELGFSRNPSNEEKRIMNLWFTDMALDIERVLEACRKTAGISNPSIKYVDAVLRSEGKEAKPTAKKAVSPELVYERIRKENNFETERIRAEIFRQIPRLKDIMEELKNESLTLSTAMLSGGSAALAKHKEIISALNREKTELLISAGLDESALDRKYSCKKCRDTGILEDGSRCSCYSQRIKEAMIGS